MLVQLNRTTPRRDFSATAIEPPVNPSTVPAGYDRRHPVVAVFGHPGRVAGLPAHLPGGWSLRRPPDYGDVRPGELVLLAGTSPGEVAAARAALPARAGLI